uniref:Putative gamma-glutamylcyclotransferase n=1 Tax=Corethron hystrix TaxID=216773 RepID=A0A6U5II36_9STRA|mmetsp:Transcript_34007/g.78486  ORF Transcript_34007/g.78486 Transcript_34007/m.78486 type:complete len:199 (+) Transcript_34007:138-734(+)|eukprot:CAMPEP_0113300134 /NCGR_PEP_ID=MMETSP0010_2-20120614/1887_1 /TAXON_ID=216773 ORGANISM="Corethron hystrix, Strain 308" /NCGR_SAMPLE_ID=MMETSP0010_2 /ASSEMBLY_ACC=CAM_ASM_000155 /LENGTH=198 /DNA_ID=CAMNT_0000153501 /DNA_START=224 /DNA_END=820 /DNA_ORIENTATION=- /assembly_acc=CAM_ASM_000155
MVLIPSPPLAVYGTLLSPNLLRSLLGRLPPVTAGILLPDHRPDPNKLLARRRVRDQAYPGLLLMDRADVDGDVDPIRVAILDDLTEREMAILDAYEDDEYSRTTVTVRPTCRVSQGGGREILQNEEACDWALGRGKSFDVEWDVGDSVLAQVYLWTAPNPERDLELETQWVPSLHFFPVEHLYINRLKGFAESIGLQK